MLTFDYSLYTFQFACLYPLPAPCPAHGSMPYVGESGRQLETTVAARFAVLTRMISY